METLREDKKREDVWRGLIIQSVNDCRGFYLQVNGFAADLGHSVATHDCGQSSNVYNHEDALRAEDVPAFVGDVV